MSRIVICLDCKRPKEHRGHGLCDPCYLRAKRLKNGARKRCSHSECPCFSALPDLDLCKGHIGAELSVLGNDEFEARVAEMFFGQFAIAGECWEFDGTRQDGYGRIWIKPDGIKRRIFVHHLVVQLRVGRRLEGDEFGLHHCDNPPCFRPSHLYKGSHANNAADAVARNRTARGDRNTRTKLTPGQIREIVTRHTPRKNQRDRGNTAELAREFQVDKATILRIIRNGHWSLPEGAPAGRSHKPRTRLTPEQIQDIATRHQPGFTRWDRGNTAQLAEEFGVGKDTIAKLAARGRRSLQEAS